MRKPATLIVLVIAVLLGALAAKSWLVPLPSVRKSSTPSEFNVHRAQARLTDLIGEAVPHPGDTAANDIVRDRLVAQLSTMGLKPLVRDVMACNALEKARGVSCARVRNVVATIGPGSGRHLLLNAHYDSSTAGPGAGDDGAGVATLLEVAFILKDEPLRRPVTFLFNEGEELGLVGAQAFLQRDPLAARVDSLINLEARGTTGPVNMFETSRPNGAAIRAYSRAVKRPVASSLATDVYLQLPNYTDVNSFAERGWTMLNLAMTGNETRYHSAGDDLHALDDRSLQHMGDQTLGLSRELAKGVPQAGAQRIFMDLLGVELITLPQSIGLVVLALLVLVFAWIAWRRQSLGRPLLTMLASLLIGTAAAWLGEMIVGLARPGMFWRAHPLFTHLAVYASMIAAGVIALRTIGGKIEIERLRTAYWLLFLLIGVAIALIAPGGIIYF
ncbi:MAG TPA: M20/M25/M40 family metallo-hydrolase, partial [Sphingomicrobium sp.]|nr:M20/M25/M40 family metallo-hydrolase [Sphingomicrobium sp.]